MATSLEMWSISMTLAKDRKLAPLDATLVLFDDDTSNASKWPRGREIIDRLDLVH